MRTPLTGFEPASREAATDQKMRRLFADAARDLLVNALADAAVRETRLSPLYLLLGQVLDDAVEAQKRMAPPDLPLACAKGCGACCHVHVAVTPLEVAVVWITMQQLAQDLLHDLRTRVAERAAQIQGTSGARRLALRVPCPLLNDETGSCMIYRIRPLPCRAWNSEDAAACGRAGRVVGYWPQRSIYGGAMVGIQEALLALGLRGELVELTLALRILCEEPEALARWLRGEDVFAAARVGPAPLHRAGLRVLP